MSGQIQVTIRGGAAFQRKGLINEFIEGTHRQGFAVDLCKRGMAVGGTFPRLEGENARVVIDDIQEPVAESVPHRRWSDLSPARHAAVLALIVLAITALVTGGM